MIRRVAMLSVHTSPLDAPGGGDAGGMNVYIVETAKRLADAGTAVEVFTRTTASDQAPAVEMYPGVTVRHITAGPFEGLGKADLPAQLCMFTAGVLRAEAFHEPGWYDVIHSHYWLSGQVGWLARDRWGVPLVHSAHTLGKVKNTALAAGDAAEPLSRIVGEEQVVSEAERLVASTVDEARELITLYGADPARIAIVPPGVDLDTFSPASEQRTLSPAPPLEPDLDLAPGRPTSARERLGIPPDDVVLLFVGRIQQLKAPDVLLRAAAAVHDIDPDLGARLRVVVLGAPSGSGLDDPGWLPGLAAHLGILDHVEFHPPVPRRVLVDYYRAGDLTVVPSYNESFGLVALESQACGTPVLAAAVGGLPTAVADGRSGRLVIGHDPQVWAAEIIELVRTPGRLTRMAQQCRPHAEAFSWQRTTHGLLATYREAVASMHSLRQAVGD